MDCKSGILLINKEIKKHQRELVKHIFKEVAYRIMRGKSLLSLLFPVNINEGRTMQCRISDSFTHFPYFLEKAGQEMNELEQIKLGIAAMISTLYKNISQLKPYNSLIGETYHVFIGDSMFYSETIDITPLTLAYLLIGKNYRMEGTIAFTFSQSINSFKGHQLGISTIHLFSNNHTISFSPPSVQLNVLFHSLRD